GSGRNALIQTHCFFFARTGSTIKSLFTVHALNSVSRSVRVRGVRGYARARVLVSGWPLRSTVHSRVGIDASRRLQFRCLSFRLFFLRPHALGGTGAARRSEHHRFASSDPARVGLRLRPCNPGRLPEQLSSRLLLPLESTSR